MKLKSIITLLFAAIACMAQAQYSAIDTANVSYRTTTTDKYSAERCRLDIHRPASDSTLPIVVYFHGGGLTGGNKKIPKELKNSGLIVLAPNYRLLPNVEISDCIDDAAAAIAWAFENAESLGGDRNQIFVSGHSAGGYLTSMTGLDKKWLRKYGIDADSIAGLIPYSGQVITHFAQRKKQGMSELQPLIDDTAPLYHVRPDCPPYVIITGDADLELYGRYEENLYMWRMMKLVGHPDVSIYKLDGYRHGNMPGPAHQILKDTIKRLTK